MDNLLLAIQSLLVIKARIVTAGLSSVAYINLNPQKRGGWFAPERWPDCAGLGGRFGPENALETWMKKYPPTLKVKHGRRAALP
jgi:hypothetical protein